MNDYKNFCELTVKPETGARGLALKIALIVLYTLFTAAYVVFLYFILEMWTMLILLPFIMYAIFTLTWRYTQLEYEFAIETGELSVAKIYDGRSRRTVFRCDLSEATRISPLSDRRVLESPDITSVKDFSASPDSAAAWYVIVPDGSKKLAAVIETNDEMLRILRLANPSAFVK